VSHPGPTLAPVADLNPAQRAVLDALRAPERPRPRYEPGLRQALRTHLEDELGSLAALLDRPVVVTKRALGEVLTCEAHHVAQSAAPFEWNVALARGVVVHRAIQLGVFRRDAPPPLELVDDALDRLADDPDANVADYLLGLPEAERAELRGAASEVVSAFTELWPPLARTWYPRTETPVRAELCGGKVVLTGRVDLSLGVPDGDRAGRVLIDLKTGATSAGHLHDLRFYALLETLRSGVPPLRLATSYLEAGDLAVEEVDEDVLEAAVRRTVQGARAVLELRLGLRSPAVTPNPACRWCPARSGCEGAVRWEEARMAS
jgi:RecB family exonuclease